MLLFIVHFIVNRDAYFIGVKLHISIGEEPSRRAGVDVFAEMGVEVTVEDFVPFMGTGVANFLGGAASVKGVKGFDPEAAKKRFFEIYLEKYAKPNSGIGFPGPLELINQCKSKGLKVAVASSADCIKVDANLAAAGLPISMFDAIVSADAFENLNLLLEKLDDLMEIEINISVSSWQIPNEVTELRKKQDDGISKDHLMSVPSTNITIEKASAPTTLGAPAVNTGGCDATTLRTSGAGSSSALDLIKKKLQDSGTPVTSSAAPVASGTEMLKERGVAPFSKWEKELPKIVFVPRFKAIPSQSARRALFEHYVKTRAEEECKEKRAAQKAAIEGFKQLLEEALETFRKKWGSDPQFKALDRKDQELLLNERVLPLKRVVEEKAQAIRAAAASSFKSMLKEKGDVTKDNDPRLLTSPLKFPSKLAIDILNNRLFTSDSNHNRIIGTILTGGLSVQIGSSREEGLRDGSFEEATATFNRPQGLAYNAKKNILYVADTENHALREIDFVNEKVQTLAGNGTKGLQYQGGDEGSSQLLNSPWEVCFEPVNEKVCIAMAGRHQIWEHNTHDGVTKAFRGDGYERNLNGSSSTTTSFAQPSEISLSPDFTEIYVADSESSSIRALSLKTGGSRLLVGGDPFFSDNLFKFGDHDGTGSEVLLQHPLAVFCAKDGQIYFADRCNHKIKKLDPASKGVSTLAGTGKAGFKDGTALAAQLSEPSEIVKAKNGVFSVSLATNRKLLIADTNNSVIRYLDLKKKEPELLTLELKGVQPPAPKSRSPKRLRWRSSADTETIVVDGGVQ
ncbi:protein SUPPRESSOR OF QUENCHING 1, chloroplastic-like [Pistacia vera]|uniref:protein SUPPRESSOR OF QUENCHING 1, chloroplastic-like n=1 Tax=Pistacia vera TaxID=55513 RepID=UPI00126337E8|nr:protein SUPPRESSOR OF QUENCHING 1, chloroplastic-like [Pistacia vera]